MMTENANTFEGWAILELMGHRRLAGKLSEAIIGGASFIRIDVPTLCTGTAANWCPLHGDCKCPHPEIEKNDPGCPLHNDRSPHGEEWAATQFYSASAVYCITPTTEDIARKVAASAQPAPVQRWELPPASSRFDDSDLEA